MGLYYTHACGAPHYYTYTPTFRTYYRIYAGYKCIRVVHSQTPSKSSHKDPYGFLNISELQ